MEPKSLEGAQATKIDQESWKTKKSNLPEVSFTKISYDGILGDLTAAYGKEHPDTPFHEIIDIIRPKADSTYLDQIARHCVSETEIRAPKNESQKEGDGPIFEATSP